MLCAPFLTLSLRPIRENLSREISKDPWLYPACSLITRNTRKGKKTVSESFPFKQIILLKRDFSSFLRDINLDVYIYIYTRSPTLNNIPMRIDANVDAAFRAWLFYSSYYFFPFPFFESKRVRQSTTSVF